METVTVYDGKQSVPLFYDNTTVSMSEVTVSTDALPIGRDWSIGSPQTLVLWVYGDPGNNEQLYLEIGNTKALYDGDIAEPIWRQWNIDLVALGIDLSDVPQLSIGVERKGATGGSGMVLVDGIRLYGEVPSPL